MRRILYVQYTNPGGYPPLEHSSRILADAGWQVLFLGTGALGAGSLRFPPHPAIEVRQLNFQAAGWRQKLHYARFCLWCFVWALKWRPAWIYASDMLACPAALLLNAVLRIRLLYHEHDSPAAEPSGRIVRLCLAARKACARRAALCVLPNRERAERFIAETQPKHSVAVVWNCPSKGEAVSIPNGKHKRGLRLLYHGSIVPERIPLTVIEALTLLADDVSLTVVGYETAGSEGYIARLRERANQLGLEKRLNVIGTLPTRSELLDVCRSCDVGLALMPRSTTDLNCRTMAGASNKPFDYLACGLAVVVSDLPDWREMFVNTGFGLACDASQPDSIAAAIRRFYDLPNEMRAMAQQGRLKILSEWNYETQFAMVQGRLVENP